MANVKISALPSWTGTAADLRWFVMNNSGNTETFKYSGYTSGVRPVSGRTNSFMSINYTDSNVSCIQSLLLGGENNSIASTDATGRNTIIGGNDNAIPTGFGNTIINGISSTNSGNNSIIAGGQGSITDGFGNGLFGGVGNVGGNYSAIVGGYSNIIGGTFNDRDVIAGGQNNIFYNASNSFIGGGSENDVYGATVAVVAGYNNTLSTGNLTFVAGTQDNIITQPGYTFALIGGGYNTVNNQNNSAGNAMYSSYFCSDTTLNDGSVLGNSNNWFSGARNCNLVGYGKHNHISNSYNSTITNSVVNDANTQWFNKIDSSSASTITTSSKSQILGGESNTITTATNSVIIGGSGHTMTNSVYSAIIGGTGSTNSNKINSVMLGTSGRTAIDNHTTYVENLKVFNQIQEQFYDNGTIISGVGGYLIDWGKGAKQTITITGGTNYLYYYNNVIAGRCVLKVINTGAGTINWADNAPKNWKLPLTTPTNQPTAMATDIFVWESFDDQGLWLTTHSENLT